MLAYLWLDITISDMYIKSVGIIYRVAHELFFSSFGPHSQKVIHHWPTTWCIIVCTFGKFVLGGFWILSTKWPEWAWLGITIITLRLREKTCSTGPLLVMGHESITSNLNQNALQFTCIQEVYSCVISRQKHSSFSKALGYCQCYIILHSYADT